MKPAITGRRARGKSNSTDKRPKGGLQGRRERALSRREKDLEWWTQRSRLVSNDSTEPERQIKAARRDIEGLKRKLGIED